MIRATLKIAIPCLFIAVWTGGVSARAEDAPLSNLSAADRKQIESLLGSGIILQPLPGAPLLAATDYLPKKGNKFTYTVMEKGKKNRDEIHTIVPVQEPGSNETFRYDRSGVGRSSFVPEGEGLAVDREYDLDKQVVSTFNPPQPLIVSGLAPGDNRESLIAVAVADIADPNDIDYRGKLKVTYSNLGRFRIKVPAGTYDADLVKWTYAGDIGPASVETAQYRFIAKDAGMVAMVQWRSVSAVLIYHERSRVARMLRKVE
ncbi:MAG TPA: hypothetical protein VM639_13270 [Dongiaceae bacterium]|nr:hypothetical protein [Dongiaceae bacterium]